MIPPTVHAPGSYPYLAEMARICANNARESSSKDVARELWKMANEYRAHAMAKDSGVPIDIGPPPSSLEPG
jgi:hypothetical protein